MCRCYICNWADFSTSECLDQSEDFPGRNAVHYRKSIKEFVCNYCFQIVQTNRRFYHVWGAQVDKVKIPYSYFDKAPIKGANDSSKRPKQDNQEKVLALPKPKLQVE